MRTLLLVLTVGLISPVSTLAELSVPRFFSDHMVLQRESDVAIWGTASSGADVEVTFKGESVQVKAGEDGAWRAEIPSGQADAKGANLTIASDQETVTIKDVLVGEG